MLVAASDRRVVEWPPLKGLIQFRKKKKTKKKTKKQKKNGRWAKEREREREKRKLFKPEIITAGRSG